MPTTQPADSRPTPRSRSPAVQAGVDVPVLKRDVGQPQPAPVKVYKKARSTLTGKATFYENGTTAMRLPRGTVDPGLRRGRLPRAGGHGLRPGRRHGPHHRSVQARLLRDLRLRLVVGRDLGQGLRLRRPVGDAPVGDGLRPRACGRLSPSL